MKRTAMLVVVLVVGLAVAVGAVQAADRSAETSQSGGVRGAFSVQAMMHTSTNEFPALEGANPWNGRSSGLFAYRSIPCTGNAPVNNISSDLPSYNGRVRGSRLPSSTRLHPFAFRVRRTARGNELRGSITLTVCKLASGPTANPDPVPDASKPKIRFRFVARSRRASVESVYFAGTFRLTGGTQRYEGIRGSGTIQGYLMCLGPDSCASRGAIYRDGQISLQGRYADPTPQLTP